MPSCGAWKLKVSVSKPVSQAPEAIVQHLLGRRKRCRCCIVGVWRQQGSASWRTPACLNGQPPLCICGATAYKVELGAGHEINQSKAPA